MRLIRPALATALNLKTSLTVFNIDYNGKIRYCSDRWSIENRIRQEADRCTRKMKYVIHS